MGSHLCDKLLERGHAVHVLDDLSTGSLDNIRHLLDRPGFDHTIDSAANAAVVAELITDVDAVYHLAAAVGVKLVVASPVRAIETNVHCTEVVLMEANRSHKPVLITSTSEVYGKSRALPFRESGDLVLGTTTTGRWAYACSKAIDEFLAIAYWNERKLPTVVVRLFNTVGPRQTGQYGMVIPRFLRQALANQPLTVYGTGTQQRCFCHVADVVEVLADMLADDRAHGEVINVGGQDEISIIELARRVIAIAGSESGVSLVPYEQAYERGFEDMERRVPDISKVGALFGWRPTRSLDDVIADTMAAQQTVQTV